MARVITARRPDTCRAAECSQQTREIHAGERINYGGYNAVTHEACPPMDAAGASARNGYRAPGAYRRSRGSKYAYTSTGARMTMSSRRCEDAPCCGCCD